MSDFTNNINFEGKRPRRFRSARGQLGDNDLYKKGKGGRKGSIGKSSANQDMYGLSQLEKSGAAAFLQKTYEMICTCDPDLGEWSDDGETFVVKDTKKFALKEIPKFFEHNNFSSFSRQLNFYGFKKVPNKTVRLDEYDKSTAGHVRFHNENFKSGRVDLLSRITRSTKNGGTAQNQAQEIKLLKERVDHLENIVHMLQSQINQLHNQSNGGQIAAQYEVQSPPPATAVTAAPAFQPVEKETYNTDWEPAPVSDAMGPPQPIEAKTFQAPPPPPALIQREFSLLRGLSTGFDDINFDGNYEVNDVPSSNVDATDSHSVTDQINTLELTDNSLPPVEFDADTFQSVKV